MKKFLMLIFLISLIVTVCILSSCSEKNDDSNKSDNNEILTNSCEFSYTLLANNTYEINGFATSLIDENIIIPAIYNGKAVTRIGDRAFLDCKTLKSVTIMDGVKYIDEYAFFNCTSLEKINIPDSVAVIDNDVQHSPFFNTAYYNNANNWENGILYIDNHLIEAKKTISGKYSIKQGVITIADFAFYSCRSLTDIKISNSVKNIGKQAFQDCTSLNTIEIYGLLKTIGVRAFSNTAYYNNTNNWENGILYIGDHLIEAKDTVAGEYSIKQGTITIAMGSFFGSTLSKIIIPSSVTNINDIAFSFCERLKSIEVDQNNLYYKSINGNLYSKDGKSLIQYAIGSLNPSFTIPKDVIHVCEYAFSKNKTLTTLTISNSVISIYNGAFIEMEGLNNIQFEEDSKLEIIGGRAFALCYSLTRITFSGTKEQWNNIIKAQDWNERSSVVCIECGDGNVNIEN